MYSGIRIDKSTKGKGRNSTHIWTLDLWQSYKWGTVGNVFPVNHVGPKGYSYGKKNFNPISHLINAQSKTIKKF